MDDPEGEEPGRMILSCGHEGDREEWDAMLVILKDEVCDPVTGFAPAYSTGMWWRSCRAKAYPEALLPSIEAADEWLRTAMGRER